MDTRTQALRDLLGKTVHVEVDRPIGYLHGDIRYRVNYGYIPGMMAGDGEEQDAYILGINKPIAAFDGRVIGAVRRKNDCEDKLVVAPEGMEFHQGQIAEAVQFQEQYFDSYVISLFHKSCGVLPWRRINGKREFLIAFEQFSQCWSLPKGHMEAGETEVQTAARELLEETGLTAQIHPNARAVIEYPLQPAGRKQVVFFAGEVTGSPTPRPGEIERLRWIEEAVLSDYLFADTVAACKALLSAIE